MRETIIVLACALGLAACSTAQTANINTGVQTGLTTAQTDLQKAVTFYGIAKGIALAAELADPGVAAQINTAIAVLDPLVATAQQLLASSSTDAPAIESLAAQLQSQATSLTVTAAPAVKVIGG